MNPPFANNYSPVRPMDPNHPLSHQINPNLNPSGIPNQNNNPAPNYPQLYKPPSNTLPDNNIRPSNPTSNPLSIPSQPPSQPPSNPNFLPNPSLSMYSNMDMEVNYPDVGPVPESVVPAEQTQSLGLESFELRLADLKK